ncbi:ROK family protein [Microbacterium sp. YY-01]|uniref:ROK family protein n=1 Tax=Microbacterium sp. YY-01 TaxID=3421634 RepID=UPI003D18230C
MTRLALAVDVGGSKLETALVAATGAVIDNSRHRRTTGPHTTASTITTALREAIAATLAHPFLHPDAPQPAALVGAGVGSAGPVDRNAGVVHPVNMPGLHGFALGDAVAEAVARTRQTSAAAEQHHDVRVQLGHDGGCLALAEAWLGATAGSAASLSIVVSTGIGGGFVVDGRYVAGATGNAGHLGQMRRGGGITLEEIASGPASVAWAQSQGWAGVTGEELGRDAASGNPVARSAIERSAQAVGEALADAATLIDLDTVAIGGGFSHVSTDYIDLVQRALRTHAVHQYSQRTRVVRSALGHDGPLVGAAALVVGPGAV